MGGFGNILEVDEALLGKKPTYGHGHVTKVFKIWVLGILQRDKISNIKHCILVPVIKRDQITIGEVFDKYLDYNSVLFSDCWSSYVPLGYNFLAHCRVNHSKEFVNYKETI